MDREPTIPCHAASRTYEREKGTVTDEQTLNQLKTTGAIHDAVFGKTATPSAVADTVTTLVTLTLELEVEDWQAHPSEWDWESLTDTGIESRLVSIETSEVGETHIHDCPNCGGHDYEGETT